MNTRTIRLVVFAAVIIPCVGVGMASAQLAAQPIDLAAVEGIEASTRQVPLVTSVMMVAPEVQSSFPNLAGGVADVQGNGVDSNDPRFLDGVEIITIPGTPRPAYFPVGPSCTLNRAVEFGNTSPFLPADSAGAIFVDNDEVPTEFIYQVALIDPSLVDAYGRLLGFDYLEQHLEYGSPERQVLGNVEGQVMFMDTDGDGNHDVWRVDHQGDTIGNYGPPPFVLDIDVVPVDLDGDTVPDAATLNDFFGVWAQLTGNPGDPQGQVYLPLVDDPDEPGKRTLMFDSTSLDATTVAGADLPRIAPIAGLPSRIPGIPALDGWGMAVLLALMSALALYFLRRTA